MRPVKYNFIPEHQLGDDPSTDTGVKITIQKTSSLYFSPFTLRIYELNGKYVRMFADIPNKSISFHEVTGGNLESMKNIRRINANSSGTAILSVKKILEKMGVTSDMLPIKNIPVNTYQGPLDAEQFYVIDLRDYVKNK